MHPPLGYEDKLGAAPGVELITFRRSRSGATNVLNLGRPSFILSWAHCHFSFLATSVTHPQYSLHAPSRTCDTCKPISDRYFYSRTWQNYWAAKFFLSSSLLNLIVAGYNRILFLPASITDEWQYEQVTLHGSLLRVVRSILSYQERSWWPLVKCTSSFSKTAVHPKGAPSKGKHNNGI